MLLGNSFVSITMKCTIGTNINIFCLVIHLWLTRKTYYNVWKYKELITVYWKALWDALYPSHKTHCFPSHSKYFICSKWSHGIHFWLGKNDLDQLYVLTSGCIVQLNYSCDSSKRRKWQANIHNFRLKGPVFLCSAG